MSSPIKKVAVAGVRIHRVITGLGTGNLGPAIVQELVDAGYTVTVLTRSASNNSSIVSGATAVQVDYNDPSSLVSALQGHDAVVSNLGGPALSLQPALVDAAIESGVTRFIPSEFGSNTVNSKTIELPVFAAKIKTQQYLAEKAKQGKISYTLIITGGFLDWGLRVGYLANVKGGTTVLFDGGDVKFSATTLSSIGKAVAGVLKQPDETKDKAVFVQSAAVSQNQFLAAARKAKPGLETKTDPQSTEQGEQNSYKVLKSGEGDVRAAMSGFIRRALIGPGYGGLFERTDNELLGVPALSEEDVEKLVAGYV